MNVLFWPHSTRQSVATEKMTACRARVFFLPMRSMRTRAKRVPGNSANVVQISLT